MILSYWEDRYVYFDTFNVEVHLLITLLWKEIHNFLNFSHRRSSSLKCISMASYEVNRDEMVLMYALILGLRICFFLLVLAIKAPII